MRKHTEKMLLIFGAAVLAATSAFGQNKRHRRADRRKHSHWLHMKRIRWRMG